VLLLKVRPQAINYNNQFALDDPYGRDLGGDSYIASFLRGHHQAEARGTPAPGSPPRLGYLYVETSDPQDGRRYRYTGSVREVEAKSSILVGGTGKTFKTTAFALDKIEAPGPAPRYGVTYDDISTREEREYWIAGSSLKVIDLESKEVIAERVGYLMDVGQGNISGGRSPWLLAASHACPSFFRNPNLPATGPGFAAQLNQTLDFVESVLNPLKGK
jgi:3D (Asp-Asp-Asp) domain-containing protein